MPPAVLSEARRSAEPDPRLADVDRELDEIEDLVRDAHFRSALSVASSTRALLDELEPGAAVDTLRVRLEVLSATALIALGRTSDARVRLAHAVRANPELQLDEQTTSPKVIRALDSLREQPERSPWDEDAVP
ncbi:MAG: hypothetical protein O7A09_05500 [Proteobacteria bacterium]|nr:hypothetical protein [Pseudomonadota bacterium]